MIINMAGGGGGAVGQPVFTYTGQYQMFADGGKNWRIKFLTSGTLRFTDLKGASQGIDVFLVGGGGRGGAMDSSYDGGGGGGYTNTVRGILPVVNVDYPIVIGEGGKTGSVDGKASTAFNASAAGGLHGTKLGGNGGSGGGGGGGSNTNYPGIGGADGANGGDGSIGAGGTGQGTTTREFGEPGGPLYSGGGGGSSVSIHDRNGGAGGGGTGACLNSTSTYNAEAGDPNTGGGGGGGGWANSGAADGGSGIVIIRNKR